MGLLSYLVPKKRAQAQATADTLPPSTAISIFSDSDGSHNDGKFHDEKCEMMVEYLHQQQLQLRWTSGALDEGVIMKKAKGVFTSSPKSLENINDGFRSNIELLNVKVRLFEHYC